MTTDAQQAAVALEAKIARRLAVCGPDGLSMVGEDGTPALAGRPGWPAPPVAADGAGADGDADQVLEE